MIAIVASNPRERSAFSSLCEHRAGTASGCDSVRAFRKLLRELRPAVVLTRHRLADGYSDDVIAALDQAGFLPETKVIVLAAAGTPQSVEARQVAIGADCVQRDPVRTDVLVAYLTRYVAPAVRRSLSLPCAASSVVAGAAFFPVERRLAHGTRSTGLTPREVQLVELLIETPGAVVTYSTLYSEILDRRFHGDTCNLRVLLGKLAGSFRRVGRSLRDHIEVIPKTGYRYLPTRPAAGKPSGGT